MFVVDFNALLFIYLLNFAHNIPVSIAQTPNPQNVVRIERTIGQAIARLDLLAFPNQSPGTIRNRINTFFAGRRGHDRPASAFRFTQLHPAVNFGQNCRMLGFARLEEFFDTRQTGSDVPAGRLSAG